MMQMIPEELVKDLQVLKDHGLEYQMVEDGLRIYIIFKDYPLPPEIYNMDKVELMIFTTPQYPNAGFDMFWTDPKLTLKNGGAPKSGEQMESYMGRTWRRFSWHPYQGKGWNPSRDSVISFKSYIDQRLQRGD